jgi:CDP-diacylglycerol--serine O-phosphatidyltransferase
MFPYLSTALFWQRAFVLTLPLMVGGILHMLVVRFEVLPRLRVPLHLWAFGANKTWRGILLMPLLTIPGSWLAQQLDSHWQTDLLRGHAPAALGLLLGLAYVLSELPNSFLKRRLGVRPGETSTRYPWLFSFLDQTDSAFGCILVYAVAGIGDGPLWFALVFFGAVVHVVVNLVLWACGLRRQPL